MMDVLAQRMIEISGVLGAMVINSQGKILSRKMPELYKDDQLVKFAESVTVCYSDLESAGQKILLLQWQYGGFRLFACKISGNILAMLAGRDVSIASIKLALSESGLNKAGKTGPEPAPSALEESPDPVRTEFFGQLEEILAEYIGPVAGILIEDKLGETGISRTEITSGNLEKLVNALSQEIDDKARGQVFRQRVRQAALETKL